MKIGNLTMSGQYFSLEAVISRIYAKFPIRMMLSHNSTLDVRMDFSLSEWSLDYGLTFNLHNIFSLNFQGRCHKIDKNPVVLNIIESLITYLNCRTISRYFFFKF